MKRLGKNEDLVDKTSETPQQEQIELCLRECMRRYYGKALVILDMTHNTPQEELKNPKKKSSHEKRNFLL